MRKTSWVGRSCKRHDELARDSYNEQGQLLSSRGAIPLRASAGPRHRPKIVQKHEPSSRHGGQPMPAFNTMQPYPTVHLGTLSTSESVPLLQADRRRHVALFGQTGTGKTGLLLNLMQADLLGGGGFCFLDPHGDAAQDIAALTPESRSNDVLYFDPSDPGYSFAFNPLSGILPEARATAAANIVSAFKNIWAESWGPRLEFILSNSLRLLLDTKDQTLLGLPFLLTNDTYRQFLAKRCQDPVVRSYWMNEYPSFDQRQRNDMISPIQNKIGILLANPFIRSILCQPSSTLDIQTIMDKGQVLIINLAKGNLGTDPAHLMGAILITAFAQAAEARRKLPEDQRRDFTLYCDEFQNFATDSFAGIMSEARKFRLSLVIANQHVSQLPDTLREAVFGNVGTMIAFRVGALDAPLLARELSLGNPRTLQDNANFSAWVKLMSDGTPIGPLHLKTPPPIKPGTRLASVIARTQGRHMLNRSLVNTQIENFLRVHAPQLIKKSKKRRHPDR